MTSSAKPARLERNPTRHRVGFLLLAASLSQAGAASAQLSSNQVYTAVTPCRIVDTRLASPAAMLSPGAPRAFDVIGATSLAAQGGNPSGCRIPGYGGSPPTRPRVSAVMVSFIAVAPQGAGNLRAWAAGEPPNASVLNYRAETVASGVVVPLDQDATPGADLSVRADVAATHLVIDVLGYFTELNPLAGEGRPGAFVWGTGTNPDIFELCTGPTGVSFGLSEGAVHAEDAPAACEAGFWVCSRAERGTAVCDTQRTDLSCDARFCDNACFGWAASDHFGWLADGADRAGVSHARSELGTEGAFPGCTTLPVWCCTW